MTNTVDTPCAARARTRATNGVMGSLSAAINAYVIGTVGHRDHENRTVNT